MNNLHNTKAGKFVILNGLQLNSSSGRTYGFQWFKKKASAHFAGAFYSYCSYSNKRVKLTRQENVVDWRGFCDFVA
jgi:hypothetical protein